MKKILLTLVAIFFVTGLFAQTDGTGLGWSANRKKENFKDSVYFNVAPTFKAGQYLDVDEYVVMKHADTLLVTDNYQLVLADDGRTIAATKATGMYILIPEDATVDFPEGTVINVFMGGAGPVGFQGVGSVILHAAKDSTVINTQWGWATLRKRATNIWQVFGHLED